MDNCTYRETGCGSCENQINCPYDKMTNKEAIEQLYEYVKNKQIILDREILALQAKKDAYHDIELELYGYVNRCVDNEEV